MPGEIMIKKILLIAVVILLAASMFAGCASYKEGAATTGYAFVQKIVAQDYSAAYDYVYSFTSDVQSRQDFIDRFTNIYKALDVTGVALVSQDIALKEGKENEYLLKYTLKMESGILGSKSYEYTADVVGTPQGYSVIYTPSLILPMLEEGDKVRVMNQYGVRGEIFTADGKLLAKNDFAQSIYLDMEKQPDIAQVKSLLSSMFDADESKIQKKYDTAVEKEQPMPVLLTFPRDTLTQEQTAQIEAVNGLGVDSERLTPTRYYPFADNAAHLVGYMGSPTEKQLAADETLSANAQVGQMGIEAAYESTMRSTDGNIIYVADDKGEMKEVLYEDAKADGSDVYLTIDSTMQNSAYTLLASNCKEGQSGAVIVMDYTNGDVKAMVSYPSFDPNLFNFPMKEEVWKYYNSEENLTPLFSRTTQALYMPGSTFKPFSCVPMFENGVLDENIEPQLDIQNDTWLPNVKGWHHDVITRFHHPDQPFNFEYSMKSSDNIFFAYFGIRLFQQDPSIFPAYAQRIGIGETPQFELPLSKSSLMNEGSVFDIGMAARSAYGMGELHITPLQLCTMYTAFMNEGDILNPTVVKKLSKTEDNVETVEWENSRTVFKSGIMKPATIDRILPSLRRVIVDGTAYDANLQDVVGLVAKTGTARIGAHNEREVNWAVAVNTNSATPLIYLVVVDTNEGEGTIPKLSILRGLVKPEDYNNALLSKMRSESVDTPTTEQGEPDHTYNDLENVQTKPKKTDPPSEPDTEPTADVPEEEPTEQSAE